VKVVSGETMLTSIRQGLGALLNGALALMAVMFLSAALMLSVLFSAIIAERKRELGLLSAIGARRGQIIAMLMAEAIVATTVGGFIGIALGFFLMRIFAHSLVYHLEEVGVPFDWLGGGTVLLIGIFCVLVTAAVGATGSFYPAWRVARTDPYELVRSEG
jgi:putative ABC transport system permease protein